MKKYLLLMMLTASFSILSIAQPCTGDIYVLEGENIEIWKVQIEGSQVLSLGAFQGAVNVGGSNFTQDDSEGWWGLYVASHDLTTGAFNWAQQIVGPGFFVTNPVMTSNGSTVMVAVAEGGGDGSVQAMRIEAFDLITGVLAWSKSYSTPTTGSNLPFAAQAAPYDGGADAAANYYITGAFAGDLDLSIATLSTGGSLSETFVFSLDENGNELWAVQSTGTNGRGRAWTLEMTPADEILIGGHFTGSVDFGGTSFTAADNTTINPYLAKLSSVDGSASWVVGMDVTTPGSFNNVYDITLDDVGNIVFSGSFNDGIDILGNVLTSEGGSDAMIGNLSTTGVFRWANQIGGVSASSEFATTVVYSTSLDAVFTGVQLATDSVFYNNVGVGLPPTHGHYMIGVDKTDGTIDPNAVESFTNEGTFGYSAAYDDATNKMVMASTSQNTGINVNISQWFTNRPRPLAHVTLESGKLDPTELLTAFDPGQSSYTYEWYKDGVVLGGEIAATYTATANGEYYVEVTSASGGCAVNSESYFILDGSTLESDSLVLVELYNNTNGANWNDNTNWLSGDVNTWFGVTVNLGRVTELFLAINNLNGDFPASIGNLSQLEQLYLDTNNLTGNIPFEFWNISSMIDISLFDTPNLTWSIEAPIQNMTSLIGIRAFNSGLTGTLPTEIGNATSLLSLDLGANSLTGVIPTSIGSLVNLLGLYLYNNQMDGAIPIEIGNMVSLQVLDFSNNQFTGSIPTEIGNLTALINLYLGSNTLTGSVPVALGNLSNLTNLNIESQDFSGLFPDEIWQIPTLQSINIGNNRNLEVVIPTNLASLTQFVDIRMDRTKVIGGPFPTGFYALTNLVGLSLGGQQFTGTLDAGVGNWTNLDNIYLWNNKLTGAFPAEITAATNLRALNIFGNEFTSFPDLSGMANLTDELSIHRNFLDFDAIIPNLGVPNLNYNSQSRRPQQNLTVDEGGALDLINDYTASGNVYTWFFNQVDATTSSTDFSIAGASIDDLGGYFCNVTNPAVPDLTIATPFYNVSFSGDPRSWTVDNSPNSVADFKSFYAATYGTNDGDTIYVAGSAIPYDVGFSVYYTPRVIYGPGYFLGENPETQASTETAMINGGMGFRVGSEGSEVYGLDLLSVVLNSQSSSIDDTLRNIHITGNRIDDLTISDDNQNILIDKNYINNFIMLSTTAVGTSRSYQDIFINNNIIDTISTFFAQATAARNDMINVNFDRNTINVFLDSIQDATVSNNVINSYQATNNMESGTVNYAGASLADGSGTLSIDNDFVSTTNVDAGAFSGSDPYVLSGIAPIPHIFALTDIGRIRLDMQAKNETADDITKLSYRLGEGGTVVESGEVKSLEAGNPVQLLFRPRLSNVTPGATVEMLLWTEDTRGVKSVPQKLSFPAETTTVTGKVISSGGAAVGDGELLLFEINQEGAAFDTLSTALNAQGEFTLANIVIGDYLALAKPDDAVFPEELPTYFLKTDLWEEADTVLLDNTNTSFEITLIARPKEEPESVGIVGGTIEEEVPDEGSGGRLLGKRRVSGAGVSARRRIRDGRGEEDTFELVAQVFSDENGEFNIENLPKDEYRINIQYPGFPMDTLTNVDFTIGDQIQEYSMTAIVDEGKISVSLVSITGIFDELVSAITVYPNPTVEDFVYINFTDKENLADGLSIGLYNMTGSLIVEKNILKDQIGDTGVFALPVDKFSEGTYILTIRSSNEVIGDAKIIIR